MKVRIRDKKSISNPIKMLDKKKYIFKLKCIIGISSLLNVILIINNYI